MSVTISPATHPRSKFHGERGFFFLQDFVGPLSYEKRVLFSKHLREKL